MKTITEAEAQKLANLLGMWIAVDYCKDVFAFSEEPYQDDGHKLRFSAELGFEEYAVEPSCWVCDIGDIVELTTIRIASDRPWTEQIWRTE